jgi:CubicO group peptidase (beta-lactamase class C family)
MRHRLAALIGAAFVVLWPLSSSAQDRLCGVPVSGIDDWRIATQSEAGFDPRKLCALIDELDRRDANIHGVVVVRHGSLIFEHYRAGPDERWGMDQGRVDHGPDVKHDLRSVSKSVTSLLVGIALDRKLVGTIDQPVFSSFPDMAALRTPEKDRIALRHLLTMASGLTWDETRPYDREANDERRMIYSTDPYRFTLAKPVAEKPGAKWNYSGGDTQLLAGVLQRSSGKFIADFAKEALFEPLGIGDFEWLTMPGNGEPAADSGLRLRPRDMARLGLLVLQRGQWNGRQVVSQAWIEESTRTHMTGFDVYPSIGYGYQWWTDYEDKDGRRSSWISAQGLGGQRIYVHRELDLVVVITAGYYADDRRDTLPYEIFSNYVVAAIRD